VSQEPEPASDPVELVTCVFSGERRPRSEMLAYGDRFLAPEYKDAFIRRLEQGLESAGGPGFQNEPIDGAPGRVFSQALRVIGQNFVVLVALCLAFRLPLDLASNWFDWHFVDHSGFLVGVEKPFGSVHSIAFAMILEFTLGTVTTGAILAVAHRSWEGRSTWWAVTDAFRCWPRLCVTELLVLVAIVIGLVLFVVPGLIVATRFFVAGAACVAEGRFPSSALGRSWRLTSDRFWTCFVIALLADVVFSVVPASVLGMILAVAPGVHWTVAGAVTWIAGLPVVVATVVSYVLYRHLVGLGTGPATGG
jgi:hypothetical protein